MTSVVVVLAGSSVVNVTLNSFVAFNPTPEFNIATKHPFVKTFRYGTPIVAPSGILSSKFTKQLLATAYIEIPANTGYGEGDKPPICVASFSSESSFEIYGKKSVTGNSSAYVAYGSGDSYCRSKSVSGILGLISQADVSGNSNRELTSSAVVAGGSLYAKATPSLYCIAEIADNKDIGKKNPQLDMSVGLITQSVGVLSSRSKSVIADVSVVWGLLKSAKVKSVECSVGVISQGEISCKVSTKVVISTAYTIHGYLDLKAKPLSVGTGSVSLSCSIQGSKRKGIIDLNYLEVHSKKSKFCEGFTGSVLTGKSNKSSNISVYTPFGSLAGTRLKSSQIALSTSCVGDILAKKIPKVVGGLTPLMVDIEGTRIKGLVGQLGLTSESLSSCNASPMSDILCIVVSPASISGNKVKSLRFEAEPGRPDRFFIEAYSWEIGKSVYWVSEDPLEVPLVTTPSCNCLLLSNFSIVHKLPTNIAQPALYLFNNTSTGVFRVGSEIGTGEIIISRLSHSDTL